MGAIHKMAPVGLWGALSYTGACSPSESYFFAPFPWICLGWYLQTICVFEKPEHQATERVGARYFYCFVSMTVSSVGLRTTLYNSAERLERWHWLRLSAASNAFAWVLFSFVFPTEKGSTQSSVLAVLVLCCGYWLGVTAQRSPRVCQIWLTRYGTCVVYNSNSQGHWKL